LKLRLPSDIEGGLLIFGAVVIITVIQLYFMKKVAYSSKRSYRDECLGTGGTWVPNEDTDDPCCVLSSTSGKGVSTSGMPLCEGELSADSFCPEVCKNDPGSAQCPPGCPSMRV